MFPYLRTAEEFLKDCKEIGYGIENDGNGYKICSSSEKTPCEFTAFYLDGKKNENDIFTKPASARYDCCKKCREMPRLVGWLTQRVGYANWGNDYGKNGVGTVQFGEIATWCQSVCRYMGHVVRSTENKAFCIGLEYYLENSMETDRVRVDMMIGGYGENEQPVIMVVELKGYYNDEKKDDAWEQLAEYCQNLNTSVNDRGNGEKEIAIIPCLFMHNFKRKCKPFLEVKSISYNVKQVDGKIFYAGSEESFAGFIDGTFTSSKKDAKEVFKEIRKRYKILDTKDFRNILGLDKTNSWDRYEAYLRPDQRYVYGELKKHMVLYQIELLKRKNQVLTAVADWIEKNSEDKEYPKASEVDGINNDKEKQLACELINTCRLMGKGLKNVIECYLSTKKQLNEYEQRYYNDAKRYWGDREKPTIIIHGGPGSGKTFIAYLFYRYCVEKLKIKVSIVYSRAAQYKALGDNGTVNGLQSSVSLCYIENYTNQSEPVIYDEAHRFADEYRYKDISGNIHSNHEDLKNRYSSLAERFLIVLYDEKQKIEKNDPGIEFIDNLMKRNGVIKLSLWTQFRCGRDEGYVSWLEQILGFENGSNEVLPCLIGQNNDQIYKSDLDFDFEYYTYSKENELETKIKGLRSTKPEYRTLYTTRELCKLNDKIKLDGNKYIFMSVKEVQGLEEEAVVVVINENARESQEIKNAYRLLMTRGLKKCIAIIKVECNTELLNSIEKTWKRKKTASSSSDNA